MCAAASKKFILELPLKVILTENGASNFISHNKKLMRFRLADNVDEYGVSLDKFSPQSLQAMILADYISKIEISLPEFTAARQEVMDLSKLIVYSMLYKQFDAEVHTALIECDCVRKRNRAHPTSIIDEKTVIEENQLKIMLVNREKHIEQARKMILDPVWATIMDNKDYSMEEKNIFILMSEKFINRITLMNWYIITEFIKNDGFNEMIIAIRNILTAYMEKSKVAEYISVMVMELALNNENANITKEAGLMFPGEDDLNMKILDPDIRGRIVAELKKKHEMVFLSWKLGGGSTSIGKQGRLQIMLYNKTDEFQEVKESIEEKKSANTEKKSLIDFYREIPEGEQGTDLGLYYLSYLDDACKKVNVKFENLVSQYAASGLTVITLNFNF